MIHIGFEQLNAWKIQLKEMLYSKKIESVLIAGAVRALINDYEKALRALYSTYQVLKNTDISPEDISEGYKEMVEFIVDQGGINKLNPQEQEEQDND